MENKSPRRKADRSIEKGGYQSSHQLGEWPPLFSVDRAFRIHIPTRLV